MKIFITGTDTDVGKTVVCSWLCLHLQADYWKPIQCGIEPQSDTQRVAQTAAITTHPERYCFSLAASPHLAAQYANTVIDTHQIQPPKVDRLIIEGAGGLLVPLNQNECMIDLIQKLQTPVCLVARTALGTINHTCLSLEALRTRKIPVLGIILCGQSNNDNKIAIETYGKVEVLAEFPFMKTLNRTTLLQQPLPEKIKEISGGC